MKYPFMNLRNSLNVAMFRTSTTFIFVPECRRFYSLEVTHVFQRLEELVVVLELS
jgi:hypothetical protein